MGQLQLYIEHIHGGYFNSHVKTLFLMSVAVFFFFVCLTVFVGLVGFHWEEKPLSLSLVDQVTPSVIMAFFKYQQILGVNW